jgi:hypothetical protein
MTAGSTFGHTTNCLPSACPINSDNLGSLLSRNGVTWKGYMESMSGTCGTTDSADGLYRAKHNPFPYYDNIRTTSLCDNVVPYTQFAADLASGSTTPRFAFVTPNMCSDMHDCSVGTGDRWLSAFADLIMASPAWQTQRSLLIVTFDEDNQLEDNRVATFAIGSPVRKSVPVGNRVSTAYTHYDLLRTLEFYLGVGTLGRNDATNDVMTDIIPN